MTTTMDNQIQTRASRIEERIDRAIVSTVETSTAGGGMQFRHMVEVMEFSKLMAVSDVAVPRHLRGNPGACLAVCIQAIEWRMSPYAVANKSYVVNDRIGYESQLIHAVIEQRAPLVGRMRARYTGEGDSRRCIVWAFVKGEAEAFEFQSAEFGRIQPKNSPLWKTKPDLQLFYNASRDWARMYFPDVILGVYADDELLDMGTIPRVASTPGVSRTQALAAKLGAPAAPVAEPLAAQAAAEGSQINPEADAALENPGGVPVAQDDKPDVSDAGDEPPAEPTEATRALDTHDLTPSPAEARELTAREACTGTWDQVKGNLREIAKRHGVTSKPDFEGGIFKFLAARKIAAPGKDLPATHPGLVRELYHALVANTFDVKSGAILNPDAD